MRNVLLLQPNSFLQRVYPKAIWNMSRDTANLYLTFDDGPVPGLTEWVLDTLQQHQALATFFCVGSNIRRHPEIFDRIRREGHQVANHTKDHVKGFHTPLGKYVQQAGDCRSLVENSLFRPPYGQLRRRQYKALIRAGYKIVLWDVISYDYEKIAPEDCVSNVLKKTRNGSIILFHDNPKAEQNLRHTLPVFLEHFAERGFSFRPLPA